MSDEDVTFGKFIERARTDKKMSLRALADQLQVSMGYIRDVELGQRAPFPTRHPAIYEKLADVLGVSQDTLMALAHAERMELQHLPEPVRALVREIMLKAHTLRPGRIALARDALFGGPQT